MDKRNKVSGVIASREFLDTLFRGDVGIIAGLPDDVSVQRIYRDSARDCTVIVLYSEQFEHVPEGAEIPIIQCASVGVRFD